MIIQVDGISYDVEYDGAAISVRDIKGSKVADGEFDDAVETFYYSYNYDEKTGDREEDQNSHIYHTYVDQTDEIIINEVGAWLVSI